MQGRSVFDSRRLAKRRTRDALIETRGNLANAARLLDCSRQNVQQMVSRHQDLRDLCEELMEENKDKWEGKLEQIGMEQSNPTAILGLLNAHARDRGYARHATDLVVSGRVDHRHVHHLNLPELAQRFARVDDDQLAAMIEQRRAAEPEPRGRMIEVTPSRRALDLPPADDAEPPDREG